MKEKIFLNWDIEDVKSIKEIDSFSNSVNIITSRDNKKYVLKEQENLERIKSEAGLLSYLREEIPIAAPIKTKNNKYYSEYENKYYILYPFLEGENFEDHYSKNSRREAKLLGETIGDLHSVLKKIKYEECKTFNLVKDVTNWSKDIIEKNKDLFDYNFVMEIIKSFQEEFIPIYDLLPKHIIHRDIHPANILFKDNRLSGIVDFELTVKGVRIFDPCYCSTSILVGDYNDEVKREKWIDIFYTILKAYNEKNKLIQEELFSLVYVLYAIQIIFMAFSCNTDNIEAAKYNERVLKWLFKNKENIEKTISTIA